MKIVTRGTSNKEIDDREVLRRGGVPDSTTTAYRGTGVACQLDPTLRDLLGESNSHNEKKNNRDRQTSGASEASELAKSHEVSRNRMSRGHQRRSGVSFEHLIYLYINVKMKASQKIVFYPFRLKSFHLCFFYFLV